VLLRGEGGACCAGRDIQNVTPETDDAEGYLGGLVQPLLKWGDAGFGPAKVLHRAAGYAPEAGRDLHGGQGGRPGRRDAQPGHAGG
jgi:hypothetical protein